MGTDNLQVPEDEVPIVGTTSIPGDLTGLEEVTVPGLGSGTDLDLAGGEVEYPKQEAFTTRADEGALVEPLSSGVTAGLEDLSTTSTLPKRLIPPSRRNPPSRNDQRR